MVGLVRGGRTWRDVGAVAEGGRGRRGERVLLEEAIGADAVFCAQLGPELAADCFGRAEERSEARVSARDAAGDEDDERGGLALVASLTR